MKPQGSTRGQLKDELEDIQIVLVNGQLSLVRCILLVAQHCTPAYLGELKDELEDIQISVAWSCNSLAVSDTPARPPPTTMAWLVMKPLTPFACTGHLLTTGQGLRVNGCHTISKNPLHSMLASNTAKDDAIQKGVPLGSNVQIHLV